MSPMDEELMQDESAERDALGRFTVEPEAAPEVVAMVEPEPEPEPAPTPVSVGKPKRKPEPEPEPVSSVVTVSVAALEYRAYSRNSASVSAVQDRLAEMGYADARADIRGWLSDGTVMALAAFQGASGLMVSGKATPETVEALMRGTGAIVVP